jgi:CRP/FNR family transcriptional activator FtrB
MRRAEEIQVVRELRPFQSMSEASFDKLAGIAFLQRFPRDVVVLEQGDPPDMLHIVVEGAVEMYAESGGERSTIAVFEPLSAFILAAVVTDLPHLMSARTLQPTRLLMIPAPVIHDLMNEDRAFALAMADELARGFRTMVRTTKNLKLRDTAPRVMNYLLMLRVSAGNVDTVQLPYEKNVIASLLGMTRESLSRALPKLREHGVVVRGNDVIFQDVAKARAMARPDPLIDDPKG